LFFQNVENRVDNQQKELHRHYFNTQKKYILNGEWRNHIIVLDEEDYESEILVVDISFKKRLQSLKTRNINYEKSQKKYSEKEEKQWYVCLGRNPLR